MPKSHEIAIVGVDFEDSGDDAIVAALHWLGEAPNRVLHALHVLDPDDVVDDAEKPALVVEAEALESVPRALAGWIAELARRHQLTFDRTRIYPHARIGKPIDTMLQVAIDYDADLIIVGTHARRGIDRLLLGSVAERLVRMARCPVLVARPKNYADAQRTKLPDPPYPPGQEPQYAAPADEHRIVGTESDIWHPTDSRPTGLRIV